MINNEILADLVTKEYYVIGVCKIKVEIQEPNFFWVSTYYEFNGELIVNETWLLSYEDIETIASVMRVNKYSSPWSEECWDNALDAAKELQSFFDTLTKSEL